VPRRIDELRWIRVGIQVLLQTFRPRPLPRVRILTQESSQRRIVEPCAVVVEARRLVELLAREGDAALRFRLAPDAAEGGLPPPVGPRRSLAGVITSALGVCACGPPTSPKRVLTRAA
jgi:hypothetical protein